MKYGSLRVWTNETASACVYNLRLFVKLNRFEWDLESQTMDFSVSLVDFSQFSEFDENQTINSGLNYTIGDQSLQLPTIESPFENCFESKYETVPDESKISQAFNVTIDVDNC